MQHDRIAVLGEEIARPVVEHMGAHGEPDHQVAVDLEPREIIVDAGSGFGGEAVLQQGIGQQALAGLGPERDQQGFLLTGQRDRFGLHRIPLLRDVPSLASPSG